MTVELIVELVIKDFQASWKYMMIGTVAACVLCVTALTLMLDDGGHVSIGVYVFVVVASCKFLSLLCMKVDDVFNAQEIYASLPVTRSTIVVARYITSILLVGVGLVVAVMAFYPAGYFQHPVLDDVYRLEIWVAACITLFVLITVNFPFYFRFGLGRGMVAILVFQLAVVSFGYIGYHVNPIAPLARRGIDCAGAYLSSQSDIVLVITGLTLMVTLFVVSVWLSCRAYRRLDL